MHAKYNCSNNNNNNAVLLLKLPIVASCNITKQHNNWCYIDFCYCHCSSVIVEVSEGEKRSLQVTNKYKIYSALFIICPVII